MSAVTLDDEPAARAPSGRWCSRATAPAREAGVALVPAVGFDYLPGDFIARLAAEGLEPLEEP